MRTSLASVAIAVAIAALVGTSFSFGLFQGFENFFEDLLVSPKAIHDDIVILAIDNESINRIGQWPWPREIFGRAFLKLNQHPPKAVGLDVVFAEPSRVGTSDDAALAQAIEHITYPVIFPLEATPLILEAGRPPRAGNTLTPLERFLGQPTVTQGHVNLILDRDGVVRRFPRSITIPKDGREQNINAFSYEVVRRSAIAIPNEASLESTPRIVFSAPTGSIKRLPFVRLLEEDISERLRGKIVFIGATAADLHDEKPTPLGRGTQMPGVEIQANIATMLISGYRLTPLNPRWSLLWILIAALIPAALFLMFARSVKPLALNLFVGAAYLVAIIVLFEKGIAANFIHINSAWILSTASLFSYRYYSGEKERREMRSLFSKYVSGHVLEEILRDPSRVALGGEEKEVTLLFSDIRGFTTLSEKTTPRDLVRILNHYFTAMTNEILGHDGVLDKYIGDAIMAFWGAPIADPDQADKAVRAALGMVEKLKAVNEDLRKSGDPQIATGIGIYTGPAVVGNVGSELRFDYTAIGDTVNAASRLEGLTKEYHEQIIIGESTKEKLKHDYRLKSLGSATVKGRKEPIHIYAVESGTG